MRRESAPEISYTEKIGAKNRINKSINNISFNHMPKASRQRLLLVVQDPVQKRLRRQSDKHRLAGKVQTVQKKSSAKSNDQISSAEATFPSETNQQPAVAFCALGRSIGEVFFHLADFILLIKRARFTCWQQFRLRSRVLFFPSRLYPWFLIPSVHHL